MTVTLKDIAREVNRSVTTVSRALHDYGDVSLETRELVKRTADRLGYTPNVAAQRLQKQRADTVGLFLPTPGPRLSDPYLGEMLTGVAEQMVRAGFDLLISLSDTSSDELDSYRQKISGRRLDSVLVIRTLCHDQRIRFLLDQDMPFVANGRVLEDWDFPFVDVDHSQGMRTVVHHLHDLGHERIAIVTGSQQLSFVHYQIQGFRQGMAECELLVDEELIVVSELTQRGGYGAAHTLLSQNDPPTAIAASNDLMAIGIMSAIQDHGLEVGQDVAVTGFDDILLADTSHPTLTTIHQPAHHMGEVIGQMLVDVSRGVAPANPHTLIEPSLVIRQSSNLDLWL